MDEVARALFGPIECRYVGGLFLAKSYDGSHRFVIDQSFSGELTWSLHSRLAADEFIALAYTTAKDCRMADAVTAIQCKVYQHMCMGKSVPKLANAAKQLYASLFAKLNENDSSFEHFNLKWSELILEEAREKDEGFLKKMPNCLLMIFFPSCSLSTSWSIT